MCLRLRSGSMLLRVLRRSCQEQWMSSSWRESRAMSKASVRHYRQLKSLSPMLEQMQMMPPQCSLLLLEMRQCLIIYFISCILSCSPSTCFPPSLNTISQKCWLPLMNISELGQVLAQRIVIPFSMAKFTSMFSPSYKTLAMPLTITKASGYDSKWGMKYHRKWLRMCV